MTGLSQREVSGIRSSARGSPPRSTSRSRSARSSHARRSRGCCRRVRPEGGARAAVRSCDDRGAPGRRARRPTAMRASCSPGAPERYADPTPPLRRASRAIHRLSPLGTRPPRWDSGAIWLQRRSPTGPPPSGPPSADVSMPRATTATTPPAFLAAQARPASGPRSRGRERGRRARRAPVRARARAAVRRPVDRARRVCPPTAALLLKTSADGRGARSTPAPHRPHRAGGATGATSSPPPRRTAWRRCRAPRRVGVTGYTLGGGAGWLSRSSASPPTACCAPTSSPPTASCVTRERRPAPRPVLGAARRQRQLRRRHRAGVPPVPRRAVYAGIAMFDAARAAETLAAYREWAPTSPTSLNTAVVVMTMPPLPQVPEAVRGRRVLCCALSISATRRGERAAGPAASRPPARRCSTACGRMSYADDAGDARPAAAPDRRRDPLRPVRTSSPTRCSTPSRGAGRRPGDVELRHWGGAMARPSAGAGPGRPPRRAVLGRGDRRPDPTAARRQGHAGRRRPLRPHATGGSFLNFLGDPTARDTPTRRRTTGASRDQGGLRPRQRVPRRAQHPAGGTIMRWGAGTRYPRPARQPLLVAVQQPQDLPATGIATQSCGC